MCVNQSYTYDAKYFSVPIHQLSVADSIVWKTKYIDTVHNDTTNSSDSLQIQK